MDLFHYCSNFAFLSILQERQIILSELTLSNDTLEGRWAKRIFSQLCSEDSVLAEHVEKLSSNFDFLTEFASAMGFCLSEDGDLLSQWRGYADNGAGLSIGFNKEYLEKIRSLNDGGTLQRVIYQHDEQKAELSQVMSEIKKQVGLGAFKPLFTGGLLMTTPVSEADKKQITEASQALWMSYLFAIPHLYTFKNPAFREEREWRLVYFLTSSKGSISTNALGDLSFRATHDRVVPTRRVSLVDNDVPIIRKVVLGPKNITPEKVITAALVKNGFRDVDVVRSSASYR